MLQFDASPANLISQKVVFSVDMLASSVRHWFLARSIADLLSTSNSTVSSLNIFNSLSKAVSHSAWQAAEQAAMYSASQVERATTVCFFELQDIGDPDSRKTYPEVVFLSVASPLQSESE